MYVSLLKSPKATFSLFLRLFQRYSEGQDYDFRVFWNKKDVSKTVGTSDPLYLHGQ